MDQIPHLGDDEEKKSLRFQLSDLDEFMEWASDDRVMRFLREPRTDRAAALGHLKGRIMPHPWYRAICVEDRPVGWVSATPAPDDSLHQASLGYGLAYDHRGRGIMTAVVKKVVSVLFEEWPQLERVEAFAAAENGRSQRVLDKAGFTREGVSRRYAMPRGVSRDVPVH